MDGRDVRILEFWGRNRIHRVAFASASAKLSRQAFSTAYASALPSSVIMLKSHWTPGSSDALTNVAHAKNCKCKWKFNIIVNEE